MMRSRVGCCLSTILILLATACSGAQTNVEAVGTEKEQTGVDEGSVAQPVAVTDSEEAVMDQDRFRFYLNEELLATTDYRWMRDGSYSSEYVLSVSGQQLRVTMELEVDENGAWRSLHMSAPQGESTVSWADGKAKLDNQKRELTVDCAPDVLLFENFNPALMGLSVKRYDEELGGKQVFPVLLIPAGVFELSLEKTGSETLSIAGRDHSLRRYTMSVVGLDVLLQVDDKDRLLYAEVPSQSAYYVRDGFEALAVKTVDDPLLSAPNHDFEVETNVMVPMRDGVSLATDLYRPHGVEKAPVILIRTPYGKTMQELDGRYYARRGYAVAVQDCRGRFDSEGVWKPFMHEANDGYDSIEYLGVQPWSNGKVGMIGASYVGWVQLWAARDKPPHLVTIIPNVAPPEPFYNIPYEYGSFFLLGAIWWANVLESEATADASGVAMQAVNQAKYARLLQHLPVIELDELLLGKQNVYWREWIEHSSLDEYWAPASFQAALGGLEIPVFHQSGWFDGDGIGSKLNYASIAKGGALQKLVLGPWGHQDKATRQLGDQDFGPEAIVDLPRAYLRWFDHFLKGVDNGIEREPLVSVFVMGSNHWEYAERYPLPQTTMTKLYLDSGGQANSAQGNGVLTWTLPASDSQADQYTYDPADPTPNPGYYVRPEDLDESLDDVKRRLVLDEEKAKAKAQHAKVSAERRDILVYETETLEQPLAFVGPIEAVLYASSSALDTDWVMRLCELSADGEVKALVEGRLRARFRNSMSAPELLEPGKVYEYHLDLWQTGIELPAGSKLRVEVASASFPIFSRNLNTGGHNEMETDYVPAVQTIYHDAERPSHVVLPILTLKTASSVHLELGVP